MGCCMGGKAGLLGHVGVRWLFLFLLGVQVWQLRPYIWENVAFVYVSKAYGAVQQDAIEPHLRRALDVLCWQAFNDYCQSERSFFQIVEEIEARFIRLTAPLMVVEQGREFAISDFSLGGVSRANAEALETGVLFGAGFFQGRVFLWPDHSAYCWAIDVEALHDDPPPVQLSIAIDNVEQGVLAFERGDQSWETRRLLMRLAPGTHWLRIEFINDYSDLEKGLDRNAYIGRVALEQAACGFDD